jgi:hypothetical protein
MVTVLGFLVPGPGCWLLAHPSLDKKVGGLFFFFSQEILKQVPQTCPSPPPISVLLLIISKPLKHTTGFAQPPTNGAPKSFFIHGRRRIIGKKNKFESFFLSSCIAPVQHRGEI